LFYGQNTSFIGNYSGHDVESLPNTALLVFFMCLFSLLVLCTMFISAYEAQFVFLNKEAHCMQPCWSPFWLLLHQTRN